MSSLSVSKSIDREYIENLSHTPTKNLKPVVAMTFVEALIKMYGKDLVYGTTQFFLEKETSTDRFQTLGNAFKERFKASLLSEKADFIGDDQKFLAQTVQNLFFSCLQDPPTNPLPKLPSLKEKVVDF